MNYWTEQSIEFAQQRNYLDELFKVYPINPNLRRELSDSQIESVDAAYDSRDSLKLVKTLLDFDLFPLKDSYVPFLRADKNAIYRNPETVRRIAGNLFQMGIEKIIEKCTEPKESNRQMGPLFKNWISKNILDFPERRVSISSQNLITNTLQVKQNFLPILEGIKTRNLKTQ